MMNNIFAELRRRNVFRIAGVYAVVGWLVIQVIVAVLPTFGAPPWVAKAFITLIAAGFPIALILAWAFEMTPDGMKPTASVPDGASITAKTGKSLDYVIIGGLALVAVMIIADRMMPEKLGTIVAQNITAESLPANTSIAVLPFADLSPDNDQEYFSDGIAEEIPNVLAKLDTLHVASRTSAFQFKNTDIGVPEIAAQLNVRHVVEGSVRKAGDTLRITAQLIDANGDKHLWSETYDRPLTTKNIFEIQDEIAAAIVEALGEKLDVPLTQNDKRAASTENLDAYELYLRANALYLARSQDNMLEIERLYKQATSLDPNFAEAWAGLAATYIVLPAWISGTDKDEYYKMARSAADRASELDPTLSLPYTVRGGVDSDAGNHDASFAQFDRALEIDPRNKQAHAFRGQAYLDIGYLDKAIEDFAACEEIDPDYLLCPRFRAIALLFQKKPDEALPLFEDTLRKGQRSYIRTFADYYAASGDHSALSFLLALEVTNLNSPFPSLMFQFYTDMDASIDDLNREAATSFKLANGVEPPGPMISIERRDMRFIAEQLWNPYAVELRRNDLRPIAIKLQRETIKNNKYDVYWRKHGFPPQCRPIGKDDFECD